MVTSSRTRSGNGPVLRSLSPSGRYYSPPAASAPESSLSATASAFASSTSSSFYSRSSSFFSRHRSSSPTRVNVFKSSSPTSPSVRFSIDRSTSPSRSIAFSPRHHVIGSQGGPAKKTCMCSPTTHPGSFRCSLHKSSAAAAGGGHHGQSASFPSNRLNMMRSAMTNSLVRIGGVEGELMRRSLTALIRPSSHHLRRRGAFETRPSRLSVMSKAEDPY